ncbi:G patch domain and ankyrin repeat-containing protein 1-like [Mercenaria mercenaria]|uniref:G patch domain and ankyrin repeat-containing protein 1-like n=1 Tax=Mercenaria mercenaria TaxID=6596 RepID=UPI00234EA6B5|nr:G patch domain and ankyrin repeat-containing protein 1-like [Mercenaria mercenaria]XP_045211899.2 G patch domain and ankyrin repeat-containing protein 1-like [Mercenaria mercenaria]
MEHKDLIRFVPAGSEYDVVKHKKKVNSETLTGDEAKAFYEDLIKEDDESVHKRSSTRKERRRNTVQKLGNTKEDKRLNYETREGIAISNVGNAAESGAFGTGKAEFIHIKQELDASDVYTCNDFDDINKRLLPKRNNDTDFQRLHNHLLNCAQNGDLSGLKKLFRNEKDLDADFQDGYGWTALMCAAVSRHNDVIRFLLSKGANKYILNNKGQTVLEICEEVGAIGEKIVINTYSKRSAERTAKRDNPKFFCDVCKREFNECSPVEHKSSTVHLFNLRLKPKSDRYIIPETNKGFQLMKKSGWDGQEGLGPDGRGTKYPVKTTLKTDRLCLGSKVSKKPKVTHFGPKDVEAVKSVHKHSERVMSARSVAKRERKKREQRDKQWERNLRTYMNIDL